MKVDISKIEGYAEMSLEDKVKALEGYEAPDEAETNLKNLLSKKNSELADMKKQLVARMSNEEKAEAERAEAKAKQDEERQNLLDRISVLEANEQKQKYTADYMSLGFNKEDAYTIAEAEIRGDKTTVFNALKNHEEMIRKNAIAEAMNKTELSVGNPPSGSDTDEKLRKAMGL